MFNIQDKINIALSSRRTLVAEVMRTDTWEMVLNLDFTHSVPDISFTATFHYKNGLNGRDTFKCVPCSGELAIWQTNQNINIPKQLKEEALKITRDIQSNSKYTKLCASTCEKLAYSIQNILEYKAKVDSSIEELYDSSLSKLAVEPQKRHLESDKLYISGLIYNKKIEALERFLTGRKSLEVKSRCMAIMNSSHTDKEFILTLVSELDRYLITYGIDSKPVGYLVSGIENSEIILYNSELAVLNKIYPKDTVALNKLNTVILMSNSRYTGKIKNARLDIFSKSCTSNIEFLQNIAPSQLEAIGVMKEFDILSLVNNLNIDNFIDIQMHSRKIKDLLKSEPKQEEGLLSRFSKRRFSL